MGSVSWVPIVKEGSRFDIGSCGMYAILRPRILVISRVAEAR